MTSYLTTQLGTAGDLPLAIYCALITAMLIVWTSWPTDQLRASSVAPVLRAQIHATLSGLVPLTLLSLSLAWLDDHSLGLAQSVAFAACTIFLIHCAYDPFKQGFWHHRRLRLVAAAGTYGVAILLAATLPRVELLPLVFAGVCFQRHQQRMTWILAVAVDNVEDLKAKLLSFEARRLAANFHGKTENWHDKVSKAG